MIVKPGIETLIKDDFRLLNGKRIGLLTNPGAVTHGMTSTYAIFSEIEAINLCAFFSPEHGFAAAEPDATGVAHRVDARTGLPIYSLYGETVKPTPDMLRDLDVVVCDIQDIGVRFYTYIWTISYILEACGEEEIKVIILDRPNPLGDIVAGPNLEPEFTSFVGRFNLPIQHGMTVGELAQMINCEWNPTPADLHVVPCRDWQRDMQWDATGLHFVTPSPAIPHFQTTLHYPGACLIEGTQLSEGRGTALPFEIVGAPYVDGTLLAEMLNTQDIGDVHFRPHTFMPTDNKYRGERCSGVQVHILERPLYKPIETWLAIIRTIYDLYPRDFEWLPTDQEIYERGNVLHFDRLIGSDKPRKQIENRESMKRITADWDTFCDEFKQRRKPYLIYD